MARQAKPREGKSDSFSVSADTDGRIVGRNGFFGIRAVEAWCGPVDVNIQGIGKRGHPIRGGLWVSHEAMDDLCEKWLRRRGKLAS